MGPMTQKDVMVTVLILFSPGSVQEVQVPYLINAFLDVEMAFLSEMKLVTMGVKILLELMLIAQIHCLDSLVNLILFINQLILPLISVEMDLL